MNRVLQAVSVLCALLGVLSTAAAKDRPPNIVLIMADDVGVETLGCYGGSTYPTPNIDALAKGGLRFNHCFSMPVCHPTRITLLTGRYPFRLNQPRWGSFPGAEEKNTLPQQLKKAGYATAIAGKWQLALLGKDPQHPHRLGFDQYALFGWHEGPRYYDPMIWQNGKLREGTKGKYGPKLYVDFLADFMAKNKDRPFFAFFSMALCHDVTDDLKEPVPFGPDGHYDTYAQMMAHMDEQVGRLVKAIDRIGVRDNTVILFTGDNGTAKSYIHTAKDGKYVRIPVYSTVNGKKIRGGKGDLTNGGTNVPLIANWKGTIKSGQVVDDLVDFSDWLPTCVELARAKLPKDFKTDGQSFASRLRGESAAPREWAYAERGNRRWWVRTQQWKLYNDGKLYNVAADPMEKSPILSKKQSREAAAARKRLTEALQRVKR